MCIGRPVLSALVQQRYISNEKKSTSRRPNFCLSFNYFLKQILLYMIKENKYKEGLNIYGYLFLYSVYIYVTTFLFKKREIWDYNQIFPNVKLVVLGH